MAHGDAMSKGRLLVTGTAGFIGRSIAIKALELGYDVVGLDRKQHKIDGVKCLEGDITDKSAVENAAKGADYVMHLAAITVPQTFISDPSASYSTNVVGFMNVIEAAHKENVKKFFYASSAVVYIDNFSETAVLDINKQRNHYAKSKMMNEMIAGSYHDIYGMSTIGARYFNTFGPGEQSKGGSASIVSKLCINRNEVIYGDGKQRRDHIYIDDAAKISLELLDKGTYQIYNVGTGKPISYNEIAEAIDGNNTRKHVTNPMPTYQYLTSADTTRLFETLGTYKFVDTKDAIRMTAESYKK